MLTVDVYSREELADAIEKIEKENTCITLHHKAGQSHYTFSPRLGREYFRLLAPKDIRNLALKNARRCSARHAYLEHLKQLAKRIRKMPLRTFA